MRILFLSTWYPHPPDNGSKLRVFHLLKALARQHTVDLCSFAFGTARPEEPGPLVSWCGKVVSVSRSPFDRGHRTRSLRFFSPSPIVDAPVPEMQAQVNRLLAAAEYDVVVASTAVTATYAFQASAAAKMLEEHNCHTRWAWERYQGQRRALGRLQAWASWQKQRRYDAGLYARFDLCTMVSEQDRAASQEILDGRGWVEVVPNGVDCGHNRPGLADVQPGSLVYNGALTYSANYEAMRYFLADVYPMITAQEPEASLTITGSTEGVDVEGLELDESVQLSGFLEDVRSAVASASVCVVPLRSGGGTRLKILEAMALGTPVVSTTKAAEGLRVRHGHDILIADEAEDMAGQVIRLLREPALGRRLAAEARRLVETEYDWRIIGQQFARLVERAAREGGVR